MHYLIIRLRLRQVKTEKYIQESRESLNLRCCIRPHIFFFLTSQKFFSIHFLVDSSSSSEKIEGKKTGKSKFLGLNRQFTAG